MCIQAHPSTYYLYSNPPVHIVYVYLRPTFRCTITDHCTRVPSAPDSCFITTDLFTPGTTTLPPLIVALRLLSLLS